MLMKVTAKKKIARLVEDEKESLRQLGKKQSKKLIKRVVALQEARSLADFLPPNSGAERCHELVGDRDGVFSMDLEHPTRLLFVPKQDDEDGNDNGRTDSGDAANDTTDSTQQKDSTPEEANKQDKEKGTDLKAKWGAIKSVELIEIADTHK
jgi:proteic killer suppression protein